MDDNSWQSVTDSLIKQAMHAGATDAEVLLRTSTRTEVVTRMGETDGVLQARETVAGLRVFSGTRSVVVSGSDISEPALAALVDAAMSRVRFAPEDPFAGLPDVDESGTSTPDLDLYDPQLESLDIEQALSLSYEAERAAFGVDPRISNSEGSECVYGCVDEVFSNSRNVYRHCRSSRIDLHVVPLAIANGVMERDSWFSSKRYLSDLADPATIGELAAHRALRRLSAVQALTCKVPVIFEARAAASLLGDLATAVSGYQIYKKSSYLCGKIGEVIGSALLNVEDNPLVPRGPGSRPFDGDGLLTRRLPIVENGRLLTYLTDTYSGRRLGVESTRNANRNPADAPMVGVSNLRLRSTDVPVGDLISEVKNGVMVTELFGFGVNTTTGSYSRGAAGIWIENGRLTYPVHEFTIASTLPLIFAGIVGIADDAHPDMRFSSPSLLISEMTIAGK
ncbi:MAG: TldD/PmbA family protein [Myxococcales bacterium]|nr:TldD/PmbA family protein [Myxococcales bacterium]